VTSLHTDAVAYARLYARLALQRMLQGGAPGVRHSCAHWLADKMSKRMQRQLRRHLFASDWLMVGPRGIGDLQDLAASVPHSKIRRGLRREIFKPQVVACLRARLGLPAEAKILTFSGRLSAGKNVARVATVVRGLRERGVDAHAVFAGDGVARASLSRELGAAGHFLGYVAQSELAAILTASDLFLFPSKIEIWPNAVVEARACGVPVLVDARGGGALVQRSGYDGLVVEDSDESWIDAAQALLKDPQRMRQIGAAACALSDQLVPDWSQILSHDLAQVWHRYYDAKTTHARTRGTALFGA